MSGDGKSKSFKYRLLQGKLLAMMSDRGFRAFAGARFPPHAETAATAKTATTLLRSLLPDAEALEAFRECFLELYNKKDRHDQDQPEVSGLR